MCLKIQFKQMLAFSVAFGITALCHAQTPGNTLLNVNYENGTQTSGIIGVDSTNVNPVGDAAYMVSPGATGNYAIAHKIIGGDPAYQSDGNTRSEADAIAYIPGRFKPGDIRRYEVSILLKDWVPFDGVEPAVETNIFQLKMSEGLQIPLMIRTMRNQLRLRYGNMDGTNDVTDVFDVRPYVNQWMHFRIDAYFTTDATGYVKVYAQLPGQSGYSLLEQKLNRRTFTGDPAAGNIGYIKWGLYVAPQGVTRIAYHDDIRIINLNPPPATAGIIWGNSIPDANPAYLDGPYTKATTVTDRDAYNSGSNVFIEQYLKFTPSQNIVYSNSTTPPPDPSDNVVGTPWSDFSRTTLTPGGASGGVPGPSSRYLLGGWTNATSASTPTTINLNQYYAFQLEPISGYNINFTDIKFTVLRGSTTDPNTFELRSSADGFANAIGSLATITNSGASGTNLITFNATGITATNAPITFRLYAYGATRTTGGSAVGLNDFNFAGSIAAANTVVLPVTLGNFEAASKNGIVMVNWSTLTETNTSYFDVQTSTNGKDFATVKTVQSQKGNSATKQLYETSFNDAVSTTGSTYVRLVTVDVDGSKVISSIIRVSSRQPNVDVSVSPNPASDVVTITSANATLQVQQIFNIAGANVKSLVRMRSIGGGVSLSIDLLPKGIYIVELLQNDAVKTVRFVKQ